MFFTRLKQIANGKTKGLPLSAEEANILETGLKTKEWASLTDETFQRHIEEFLDPKVKEIEYVVVTRLMKINNFLDWVNENKKLPSHKEEHCRFFATLKMIANGKAKDRLFSTEELNTLEKGLKTKGWASLTDETFQRHIEEFLDPKVKEIEYVVVTRLMKINDLLTWVKENKKLPIQGEENGGFFSKLKRIANGKARDPSFSTEEINTLETGLKTKEWTSLIDETFQRHIEEFLDPKVKEIEYVVVTRLMKINNFLSWVRENKKLPTHKEEHNLFFTNLKQIANGTTGRDTRLSTEELNTLEKGLKTKEWTSLTDETFQHHVEEFLDPEVKEIEYVVVTRLLKINNLLDWVRENKKLPFPKEEHGQFFGNLKSIAKGKAKGSAPLSTEEIDTLEKGLKTKEWASLTDKIFQKKIKEFLDPEIEWVGYPSMPKTPVEKAPVTSTAKPPVVPTPKAPVTKPFAAKSLASVKSFIEDGDTEGKKKLASLQSLKAGTRKTGTLYPEVEEYLTIIDAEWWKKKPEELRGATTVVPQAATAPQATTTTPAAAAPTATTAATTPAAVDIILDYDDALSSGEELPSQLKKELRVLYKEKNPRLLKFMENRKITAEEFLDHVV